MKPARSRPFFLRQTHWSTWLHGIVWLLYVVFIVYVAAYQGIPVLLAHPSVHLLSQLVIFYLNYCYLIPRVLGRMNIARFLVVNLISILLLEILFIQLYHWLRAQYLGSAITTFPLPYSTQFVLRFFELILFVVLAGLIRFTGDWFIHQQQAKELENVQLRTELAFLKAQLNPHVLFNILNALYALSLRQAPETSQGIMQLSQLMRYMLYETNEERITLSKEIEFIRHYLDLQRLRLPAHFSIQFEVDGPTEQIRLEPLLLLPLIENIFKHGDFHASIHIVVQEGSLQMRTCNGIRTNQVKSVGGIGLTNLRRRLAFLYPDRHQLALEEKDEQLWTNLRISL
ncbi:sensor histidine kinase [Spirosoma endbachense]|uniref:Signal transduction histidine kinase internal region domain-containing protein n=1 Tax=Spirosoma endbachense TaxID=2666025 RepID=A0A6P1VUE8_9BACT|nr:sensor histidine kinase [Spirosoma endbachense]QHV95377.1 hypothetical protein GJR95_10310 [Spirosoma endbachense]